MRLMLVISSDILNKTNSVQIRNRVYFYRCRQQEILIWHLIIITKKKKKNMVIRGNKVSRQWVMWPRRKPYSTRHSEYSGRKLHLLTRYFTMDLWSGAWEIRVSEWKKDWQCEKFVLGGKIRKGMKWRERERERKDKHMRECEWVSKRERERGRGMFQWQRRKLPSTKRVWQ